MEPLNLKGILESLLFAAGDEGLSLQQIMNVLEMEEKESNDLLYSLKEELEQDPNRGLMIVELANTFQLATKRENAEYLKRLVDSPGTSSLSQAALETLAIISYKQPITRLEIEEIRGVKAERSLHTLTSKGLIKETGRASGAGRAILYGTTKEFLDYFGLKDLSELPPLSSEAEAEDNMEEADLFFERFQETIDSN